MFDLLQPKMRERTVLVGITRELILSLREGEPTLVSRAGPGVGHQHPAALGRS